MAGNAEERKGGRRGCPVCEEGFLLARLERLEGELALRMEFGRRLKALAREFEERVEGLDGEHERGEHGGGEDIRD